MASIKPEILPMKADIMAKNFPVGRKKKEEAGVADRPDKWPEKGREFEWEKPSEEIRKGHLKDVLQHPKRS